MLLDSSNLVIYLDAVLFAMGACTFIVGVLNLAMRSTGAEIKSLAAQTARLAQKGVAEDVAGLVGNASALLDSMNQLVRTARGVGLLLCLLGLAVMGLATWFAMRIYQVPL